MLKRQVDKENKTVLFYDSGFPAFCMEVGVQDPSHPYIKVPCAGVRVPLSVAVTLLPGLSLLTVGFAESVKADPSILRQVFGDDPYLDCGTPDCDSCGRSYR